MIDFLKNLRFAVLAVFVCAGAYATTDIQPNGNLAGGNTAANCTQPVLGTYSGSTNFEAKWRANSVPLRWYNEGNRITNVQDAAKTCTYDGALNIPSSAPSRTGYTFGGWKVVPGLPAGYTELEYIESSGTQYINTGVTSSGIGLKTEVKLQLTTNDTSERAIFGFANSCGGYEIFFASGTRVGAWRTNGQSAYVGLHYTAGVDYTIISEMTSNSVKLEVNGDKQSTNVALGGMSEEDILLFGLCNSYRISAKVYLARMWNNGSLVRNLLPAKRNSDNVIGMFDTVSQTFFTNAGTGSFTAGPELN